MISGEATNTYFIVFGMIRQGLEPRSSALKASMLSITPPAQLIEISTSA